MRHKYEYFFSASSGSEVRFYINSIERNMNNPGKWMAHCHVVEHLFAGMMLEYKVEE